MSQIKRSMDICNISRLERVVCCLPPMMFLVSYFRHLIQHSNSKAKTCKQHQFWDESFAIVIHDGKV